MKSQYIPPKIRVKAFNCPNCHVYAKQHWYYMNASESKGGYGLQYSNKSFQVSNCENCSFPTIWLGEKIIFPIHSTSEPPNPDLPEEIQADYEEARTIANLSPRGAAAFTGDWLSALVVGGISMLAGGLTNGYKRIKLNQMKQKWTDHLSDLSQDQLNYLVAGLEHKYPMLLRRFQGLLQAGQ